jgi:hypothetical protein
MVHCRCSSVVEQLFRKQQVVGSSPTIGSKAKESGKPALFLLTKMRHYGGFVGRSVGRTSFLPLVPSLVSRCAVARFILHLSAFILQSGRLHPLNYLRMAASDTCT